MSGALHGVLASLKAAAASATDAFFRYVSLLLNTTSTNGAQNNTFLDGSTNNFSITRNGNTTQGTFSPFSQTGWSNFFDGNGDSITYTGGSSLNFGTGNFTIEMWGYLTNTGTYSAFLRPDDPGTFAEFGYDFLTGELKFQARTTPIVSVATTMPTNQWAHVAACRSGTSLRLFINGTQVGSTTTDSTNFVSTTGNIRVGGSSFSATHSVNGYLSNFRVVNGTALYTSNFTPPTAPLTNITNTSLLTCQSNRFIDNSSNAFAITRNGDVSVQAFSPFNPTAAWSASTNGGSGYFDGTGDYLSVANNVAFQIGTGNFCMEGWFYTNSSSIQQLFGTKYVGGTNYILAQINRNAGGSNVVGFIQGGIDDTTGLIASSSAVFNLACWNHVVLCRTGTTLSLFVNGSRVATTTSSVSSNSTEPFEVGENTAFNRPFNGYITNVRLVKSANPYDATLTTLTVPTAPLTAITNTSLLCNFTNAGIYDSASGNDLETVGNAQVSTTQAKWGTTSLAFDGTGDWLLNIDKPALRLGTAAFTIEMWVYRSASGTYGLVSKGTSTTGWSVSLNASNQVVFSFTTSSITSTGTVAATTWTHIAVVREGTGTNQTKIYISGTNDGTGTVATDFSGADVMYVGADRVAGSAFNGYIDDLRITNGYARYTANFTAPTAAFPLN